MQIQMSQYAQHLHHLSSQIQQQIKQALVHLLALAQIVFVSTILLLFDREKVVYALHHLNLMQTVQTLLIHDIALMQYGYRLIIF